MVRHFQKARNFKMKIRSFITGAMLAASLATAALAAGPELNVTPTGLALRGYDPVSYQMDGGPKQGDFGISAEYKGATYRFASEDNKKAFEADPAKFAPQYGGYCAMGAAFGKKFDGDPTLWKVVEGKLYLNLAAPVAMKWSEDIAGNIKTADMKWSEIMDKTVEEANK
jgi:YHS domain-containing protein